MVYILIPVYNDWDSFNILIKKVIDSKLDNKFKIIAINDFSLENKILNFTEGVVEIVNLRLNQGHQKAISIGINYILDKYGASNVIIMDGDGEDNPKYIAIFLENAIDNKDKIIFAKRQKRNETFLFKIYYHIYKLLFRTLTGKKITFGNFCYIPSQFLFNVANLQEIWIHVAAAILKSKIPFITMDTERGKRYLGASKMNFTSLVIHGLSAISVFLDIVFVRMLIFSSFFLLLLFSISIISVFLKLFFDKASPGWVTNILFASMILIFQIVVLLSLLSFQIINNKLNPPSNQYEKFKNMFSL